MWVVGHGSRVHWVTWVVNHFETSIAISAVSYQGLTQLGQTRLRRYTVPTRRR